MKKKLWYEGSLHKRTMPPLVKKAYVSFKHQKSRCQNPNDKDFPQWGARGIEVRYELREFIAWWLEQHSKRDSWTRPTCGRINHDGHYEFSNIELLENSENAQERADRYRFVTDRVIAQGPDLRLVFSTTSECARVFQVQRVLLELHIAGKIESPVKNWVFSYNSTRK